MKLQHDGTHAAIYANMIFDFSSGAPMVWNSNTNAFEAYNASNIAFYGSRSVEGPNTTFTWTFPTGIPESVQGFPYVAKTYAVAGTNQVEAVPFVDVGAGSGTYTLTIEGVTTGAITFTHSDSAATTVGLLNTALDAAFGAAAVVASGGSLAAIILTFSGTGYKKRPIVGHVVVTFGTLTTSIATINGGGSASASTTTTPGVGFAAADIATAATTTKSLTWDGTKEVTSPDMGFLSPNRTVWFVRSTGSDSANNGLSAAAPFLSLAHANSMSKTGDVIDIDTLTMNAVSDYSGIVATIRVTA